MAKRIFQRTLIVLAPVLIVGCFLLDIIWVHYHYFIPVIMYYSVPFFAAVMVVTLLTPLMIFISRKIKVLDHPDPRKIHTSPMPLLGGIAIFLGYLATALYYCDWPNKMICMVIGGGILLVLGTLDDVFSLSSKVRLCGQLLASLLVISSGITINLSPNTWWGPLLGGVLTIIWILGVTNALNFADGMDGLAAGIAAIACIFFVLITMHLQEYSITLIASILMGFCTGFLLFNFKPAKIYLGDGGSTFIGFMLACLSLYGGWSSRGPVIAFGIPALILGVLIFDMCYITISRVRSGKVKNIQQWLDYTAKDHFHHRLVHLGFTEENAVVFIYIICLCLGLSALVLHAAKTIFPVAVLIIQSILMFINIVILMLVGRQLVGSEAKRRKTDKIDETKP